MMKIKAYVAYGAINVQLCELISIKCASVRVSVDRNSLHQTVYTNYKKGNVRVYRLILMFTRFKRNTIISIK